MNTHMIVAAALACISLISGCMPTSSLIAHKREKNFYQPVVNAAGDAARAADKISDLKILQTGNEFPIRAALFDNGKFYYQVDKLGDGYGIWSYRSGALELTAERPIFDMQFVVSAAQAKGNKMVIQFVDRFGKATHGLSLRDPEQMRKEGQTPPPLQSFIRSSKNI